MLGAVVGTVMGVGVVAIVMLVVICVVIVVLKRQKSGGGATDGNPSYKNEIYGLGIIMSIDSYGIEVLSMLCGLGT